MNQRFTFKTLQEGLFAGFKSATNHFVFAGALMLSYWSESTYYSAQNFSLPLYVQHCIMATSLVCLLAGLIRQDARLRSLLITSVLTLVVSVLTILCGRLADSFLNHLYLLVSTLSAFLWLLQLKYVFCFAWHLVDKK